MLFKNQVEEKQKIMIVELPPAGLYTVFLKARPVKIKTNHSAAAP
jgi:hypothetical protein